MLKNLSNKELVAAGHKFAANLDADTPLIDMAKMVSQLATQLDVALAAAAEAGKQRDALAAENAALKDTVAMLLEDARRVQQLEPNAGTESRITVALSSLIKKSETPATDAILNAVRAEGVEMFARHCDDSIGFIEPEDEELYTLIEEQAGIFAAQLRADAAKDGV